MVNFSTGMYPLNFVEGSGGGELVQSRELFGYILSRLYWLLNSGNLFGKLEPESMIPSSTFLEYHLEVNNCLKTGRRSGRKDMLSCYEEDSFVRGRLQTRTGSFFFFFFFFQFKAIRGHGQNEVLEKNVSDKSPLF